jgi:hypothetical protein
MDSNKGLTAKQGLNIIEKALSLVAALVPKTDLSGEVKDSFLKTLDQLNETVKTLEIPENSQNSQVPDSKEVSNPEKDPPKGPKSCKKKGKKRRSKPYRFNR